MTPENSRKRISAIEQLQQQLDLRIAKLEKDLLAELLSAADKILATPRLLGNLVSRFESEEHLQVLRQFGLDILAIGKLNTDYFKPAIGQDIGGQVVTESLFGTVRDQVGRYLTERFGIKPDGEVVSNGLFELFSKDTTVQRQLSQFAYGQKAAGVSADRFKKNLRTFVNGAEGGLGVYGRHYDTVAYDTYQQADRIAQQAFAQGLKMTAFLYLGGSIPSSRPFCVLRDGKVFLKEEVDKFGTAADAYGGYQNKQVGYFSGKPKASYTPFQDLGGYRCRHHLSAISDREALRRRPDLEKLKDGTLRINPEADPIPKPTQPPVAKPKAEKPKPDKKPEKKPESPAPKPEPAPHVPKGADWSTYPVALDPKLMKLLPSPVKFEFDNRRVSSYMRFEKGGPTIKFANDVRERSEWAQRKVAVHELGHALHDQRRIIDVGYQVNEPMKDLMKNARKMYPRKEALDLNTRLNRMMNDLYGKDAKVPDYLGDVSVEDARSMVLSVQDTLAALTKGKFGQGHAVSYWKGLGFPEAEVFAHMMENRFVGNLVFEREAPNLHKLLDDFYDQQLKPFEQ